MPENQHPLLRERRTGAAMGRMSLSTTIPVKSKNVSITYSTMLSMKIIADKFNISDSMVAELAIIRLCADLYQGKIDVLTEAIESYPGSKEHIQNMRVMYKELIEKYRENAKG